MSSQVCQGGQGKAKSDDGEYWASPHALYLGWLKQVFASHANNPTLVFECPAMQPVRDRYPALFSPAQGTMQLFMWQQDIVGWHTTLWIVLMPLVPCPMLLMTHQPHLHQPWRLDRCNTFSLSGSHLNPFGAPDMQCPCNGLTKRCRVA